MLPSLDLYTASRKGRLVSFNGTDYLATVKLTGSLKSNLADIPVARNIPSAEMIAGRKVQVVMFDESNPNDAIVVGVWT